MGPLPGAPGSSPLARGLLGVADRVGGAGGIIPARAGFTPDRGPVGGDRRDHPRSRGVYHEAAHVRHERAGSSPLARGLHEMIVALANFLGIIPARAGFTRAQPSGRRHRRDHPRSRGVYGPPGPARRATCGSSPLARGLLRGRPPACGERGIIPARAGFTRHRRRGRGRSRDHPRSRGVYPSARSPPTTLPGSSPLARGLRRRHRLPGRRRGIIPARAGFTMRPILLLISYSDHPRSRGVY